MTTVRAVPPPPHPTTGTVPELTRLFQGLHAEAIPYCHWKSNEHLRASLVGKTDLDLLVHREAAQPLARILSETSFKRFHTVPHVAYPGIESYFGLDPQSGALLHLHVHYQLTLGEKHLKGYRLPWENVVLGTRVFDVDAAIYVADPNIEVLLLLVRAALKLRLRDRLSSLLGRAYFRGNVLRELCWLAARVDPDRLLEHARSLVGERAARQAVDLVVGPPPTVRRLTAFLRSIHPSLAEYRLYGALAARRRRWVREAARAWVRLRERTSYTPAPTKRLVPQGGLLVAFVGLDGSGKSTLVTEITAWLSALVDVVPIYLGSGKGPTSVARRLLQGVAKLLRPVARGGWEEGPASDGEAPRRGRRSSWLRTCGELLWVVALARERRRRLRQARRARNLGMVVVCDRFLQTQFTDFNDGPAFSHWLDEKSWLLRAAARNELAAIRAAELQPPDLVIRLRVNPEVAARRRPTMALERLQRSAEKIASLRYPPITRVAEIDADEPLEHVLLAVKRAIWESL